MSLLLIPGVLDLPATLGVLQTGPRDPCQRVSARELVCASRTPEGPATLHVALAGHREGERQARVRAWGPGAAWVEGRAAGLLGLDDRPPELPALHPSLHRFAKRAPGLRLARCLNVVELLARVVLEQKVTGKESQRAWRNLVRHLSEPAPGPARGLWLPPSPEALRALPEAMFPPLGILASQGRTLKAVGRHARRVEEVAAMAPGDAARRLQAIPGVGPWSAGEVLLRGLGAADAVPLGDFHLPSVVAWNLAGERRADDARMLQLLEPFRPQRGRALRWIASAGRMPERRAPRRPLRPLPSSRPPSREWRRPPTS